MKSINLFVPGRLCIMGEHSDWASKYRNVNDSIDKGYAIVTGTEEGIYASARVDDKLIVKNEVNNKYFECNMDLDSLKKVASSSSYFSYIAGVTLVLKEKYSVNGINLVISKQTLPEKKGLSSSASICVLTARAFNNLYNLGLNTLDEMEIAYLGEINTPSKCGKLDQACAYGKRPVLLTFDKDNLEVKDIKVKEDLFFVFADLMRKKDTIKILRDLNKCYPIIKNDIDLKVHECFGIDNKKLVLEAVKCIEEGKSSDLGNLMSKAQENFDNKALFASSELLAPMLHKLFKDDFLINHSYGMKGVGSGGDGSIQILAKDIDCQRLIKEYLENELNMKSYKLTIEKTKVLKR